MAVNNPGFSVPFGQIKGPNGNMIPLYVGVEWQIFLQGLFTRTGGTNADDSERIDALEVMSDLQDTLINDAHSRVDEVSGSLRGLRTDYGDRVKELEFLGAFSDSGD